MPSPPPIPPHASPREQAARLLASAMVDDGARADAPAGGASEDAVDARMERVERLFDRISNGLTRWLGPYGVHALMTRALSRVRPAHPALAGVAIAPASSIPERPPTYLTGWRAVAREHGAQAATAGAAAILESLAEQMGRLIGDGLASTLLAQSATETEASPTVAYSGGARAAPPLPPASATETDPRRPTAARHDVPPPDGES